MSEDDLQLPELDAEAVLTVLKRHGVQYVMVGGYAARLHGAQRPTRDIDITHGDDHREPGPTRLRTERTWRPHPHKCRARGARFNLSTESSAGLRLLNPKPTPENWT